MKRKLTELQILKVKTEAARIKKEMVAMSEPNSPNKTHFMVKVSHDFIMNMDGDLLDALFDNLEFKTRTMTKVNNMKGVFVMCRTDDEIRNNLHQKLENASISERVKKAREQNEQQESREQPVMKKTSAFEI